MKQEEAQSKAKGTKEGEAAEDIEDGGDVGRRRKCRRHSKGSEVCKENKVQKKKEREKDV